MVDQGRRMTIMYDDPLRQLRPVHQFADRDQRSSEAAHAGKDRLEPLLAVVRMPILRIRDLVGSLVDHDQRRAKPLAGAIDQTLNGVAPMMLAESARVAHRSILQGVAR